MNLFNLIIFVLFFSACSSMDVKWKKGWAPKERNVTKKPKQQKKVDEDGKVLGDAPVDNWAKEYYEKTYFIIKNPKLIETDEDLKVICESPDKPVMMHYQDSEERKVMFKRKTVTFTTKGGFSKKVHISKGVCRELALYKNKTITKKKQIRKSISRVVLSYVYNEGTYLKEIEFKTPFPTVRFVVE